MILPQTGKKVVVVVFFFNKLSLNSAKILDPFEMGDFSSAATSKDIENAIGLLDKRIMEMKVWF